VAGEDSEKHGGEQGLSARGEGHDHEEVQGQAGEVVQHHVAEVVPDRVIGPGREIDGPGQVAQGEELDEGLPFVNGVWVEQGEDVAEGQFLHPAVAMEVIIVIPVDEFVVE